ncbi:MAG: FecR family protein, partial [Pirellulales bacterium]|nr:FecR family protein [Pirellulales bacterium]
YRRLRDRVLDGTANETEFRELEQLVVENEAIKRDYAECAHQEAALMWSGGGPKLPARGDLVTATSSRSSRPWLLYLVLAASLLLTIGVLAGTLQEDEGVAQLISTQNCQWGDSTLPTSQGRRLAPGRIRLSQGIAQLMFPHVKVTLEGPVDFEIINERTCFVHQGRISAKVDAGGEGFVVRTPSARLIDRGTEFGVNVLATGVADLKVFKGLVDAKHSVTGESLSVETSGSVRFSKTSIRRLSANAEPGVSVPRGGDQVTLKSVQISTAIGSGADAYVSPEILPPENCMTTALLAKRPSKGKNSPGLRWRRKPFLSFDLSLVDVKKIHEARLQLYGVATNIGFASLIPDATFSIYGLTDESEEDWDEETIRWSTAPASVQGEMDVDPAKTVLLGQFVVPQSQPTGVFSIGGSKLVEFLRGDTNGKTTLIIVIETIGVGECYVHGFASKRHPELPPPT